MVINNMTLLACLFMAVCGLVLPIVLVVVWKKKTKQPLKPVLVGAATFFISAIVLETIPKYFLLLPNNPVGEAISGNVYAFSLTAAFLAGFFEETGRLIAYKSILKKNTDRRTAISYGIGHGGFEVMYILVSIGISYFVYGLVINAGQLDLLIVQAGDSVEQIEAVKALPETIASISFFSVAVAVLERISAVMFHMACSILVFCAAHDKKKLWLYPVAILAHTGLDIMAALYQAGLLHMYVMEAIAFLSVAALFKVCYELVYKKCGEGEGEVS
ncbi:MAG: YhfC family intramembrane metalloprotease [Eubacterium sp.]|nr:YhfC family intramembrane metalloprotease [Eubacterium sp.]